MVFVLFRGLPFDSSSASLSKGGRLAFLRVVLCRLMYTIFGASFVLFSRYLYSFWLPVIMVSTGYRLLPFGSYIIYWFRTLPFSFASMLVVSGTLGRRKLTFLPYKSVLGYII